MIQIIKIWTSLPHSNVECVQLVDRVHDGDILIGQRGYHHAGLQLSGEVIAFEFPEYDPQKHQLFHSLGKHLPCINVQDLILEQM